MKALSAGSRQELLDALSGLEDPLTVRARADREEREAAAAEKRARKSKASRAFSKSAARRPTPEESVAQRERREAEEARAALDEVHRRWRVLQEKIGALEKAGGVPQPSPPRAIVAEVELLTSSIAKLMDLRGEEAMGRTVLRGAAAAERRSALARRESQDRTLHGDVIWSLLVSEEARERVAREAFAASRKRAAAKSIRKSVQGEVVHVAMALARGLPRGETAVEDALDAIESLACDPVVKDSWDEATDALEARLTLLWRRDLLSRARALLGAGPAAG